MPFIIIDVETGRPLSELVPLDPRIHDTGDEAKAYAKTLSLHHGGRKFKVKKVVDTHWKDREQLKLQNGEYQPVPWVYDCWWQDMKHIHRDHFPHASYKAPGKLAYTESPEKGMDNIHTQIKPGRYLETYFGKYLKEMGMDVQELALQFARAFEPRILRLAETEDEVQWVYENGPKSCMSSDKHRYDHGWGYPTRGKWPQGIHACRMYIAGDLALAYIVEDDKKFDKRKESTSILARSLVWPAKKTHSRIYGDEARMRGLMNAAGYRFGTPIGAKLQRIVINDNGMMRFLAPYIDAGLRSGEGSLGVIDKKTHLEITDQQRDYYPCGKTAGVSGYKIDRNGRAVENSSHCDYCVGEELETHRVYNDEVNASGNMGYRNWCMDCIDEHNVFYCNHDNRYFDGDRMSSVSMADGSIWSQRAFSAAGFTCQGNGGRYPRHQRVLLDHGDVLWSMDYFNQHGFICDALGSAHRNEEMVLMDNGQRWCDAGFAQYGFTCPKCGDNHHRAQQHSEPVNGELLCMACHPATSSQVAAKKAKEIEDQANLDRMMASLMHRDEPQAPEPVGGPPHGLTPATPSRVVRHAGAARGGSRSGGPVGPVGHWTQSVAPPPDVWYHDELAAMQFAARILNEPPVLLPEPVEAFPEDEAQAMADEENNEFDE